MPMRREGKCMRGKEEKCILFVGTGPTHPSPFQRRMEKTQKRTTSTPRNQGRRNNDKTKLMFVRSRVVKLRPRGSFTTRAWSKSDWICSDLVVWHNPRATSLKVYPVEISSDLLWLKSNFDEISFYWDLVFAKDQNWFPIYSISTISSFWRPLFNERSVIPWTSE